jgi:transmembrane sensor
LTLRRPRYAATVAAILVIGVGLAMLGAHLFAGHRTFETAVGGLATVPTEDGSVITLNTDTRIDVRMDAKARRIALQRGEAFFEVAKDGARPFVVEVGDHTVIAVGTKFSVRMVAGAVQVAVTEGKVRVESRRGVFEHSATLAAFPALSAGMTATVGRDEVSVAEEATADIEQMLSWRSGYVVLTNTPLVAAAAEFNRYNTRRLIIADPALEAITVGGNFRSNNVDGFVRLLERGFGIDADVQGNQILLRRRQP